MPPATVLDLAWQQERTGDVFVEGISRWEMKNDSEVRRLASLKWLPPSVRICVLNHIFRKYILEIWLFLSSLSSFKLNKKMMSITRCDAVYHPGIAGDASRLPQATQVRMGSSKYFLRLEI
jgi:hypothetical protein